MGSWWQLVHGLPGGRPQALIRAVGVVEFHAVRCRAACGRGEPILS